MRILLFFLCTLLSSHALCQVKEFTLPNGLKVLVKEDHRAPVVVSMVWYNVGSADEPGGITGVSHALEHLMFKGTPNYPVGKFSRIIAGLGGQENAFTNNDYTAYFEKIASAHLPTSFKLEADRMQNLLLDKEEFGREIKVIQEERRLRTDDNPQALAFERFLATAHLASPYHHPVIGWMSDLEQMQVEDAKAWYQQFYAPNNAVLVVVGDVDATAVFNLASQYFGKIPRRPTIQRKIKLEPPALGKKTVQINAPAQVPLLMLGFTTPSVKTAVNNYDPYALEIIAGILGAGDSGRLSKNLIRGKQIASNIEVYYNLYSRYQTQFLIYGTPGEMYTNEDLQKAILAEINQLKQEKISDAELKRLKNQMIAEKTFERDSIFSQAMELGLLETVGLGWETSEKYIERINSITPEQIQKAAQVYFNEAALTEAQLIPVKQQKRAS